MEALNCMLRWRSTVQGRVAKLPFPPDRMACSGCERSHCIGLQTLIVRVKT